MRHRASGRDHTHNRGPVLRQVRVQHDYGCVVILESASSRCCSYFVYILLRVRASCSRSSCTHLHDNRSWN